MDSIFCKDLKKRKEIAMLDLSSKKDNYEISSIYINYIAPKEEIDEEKNKNIKKKMLKFISYEISEGYIAKLFFDFDSCKQEFGIDVRKNLPYQFLIKIHIIDTDIKNTQKKFVLTLIANNISNFDDKIFYVDLKKAECQNNDDFVLYRPGFMFNQYYIVHKYEEDWKKLWVYQMKRYM